MERDRVPVPHTTKVLQRWAFSIDCSLSLSLEIEADHWFVVERADAESLAARLRKRVSEAYSSLGTRFSASLRPCVVNKHSLVRTHQHLGPRWNKPYCCRSSICAAHASRSRWTSTLHAIERAFSVASRSRSRHHSRSAGATSTGAFRVRPSIANRRRHTSLRYVATCNCKCWATLLARSRSLLIVAAVQTPNTPIIECLVKKRARIMRIWNERWLQVTTSEIAWFPFRGVRDREIATHARYLVAYDSCRLNRHVHLPECCDSQTLARRSRHSRTTKPRTASSCGKTRRRAAITLRWPTRRNATTGWCSSMRDS